jgi:hypothetical protein
VRINVEAYTCWIISNIVWLVNIVSVKGYQAPLEIQILAKKELLRGEKITTIIVQEITLFFRGTF